MKFSEVIGQEELKKQLIRSAQADKVSQAMLFLGNLGVGKLPMALAFAQYLNCENRTEEDSCGSCSACLKSQKLVHPDIFYTYPTITGKKGSKPMARDFIESWREQILQSPYLSYEMWIERLDQVNKQGNITAEECSQIIRQHSLRHFEGKYKIQIIWGGEYLSKEGNKLLKIIEEPPANTVFILLANSQKAILPTILSRTQIVKFPRVKTPEIVSALVKNLGLTEENAQTLAPVSEGSWLAASQLVQQEGIDYFPDVKQWLSLLIRNSRKTHQQPVQELMEWVNRIGGSGRQYQKMMLHYALYFIRECLSIQNGLPSQLTGEERKVADSVAGIINWESMSEMSQLINNLHYHIVRNANAKIGLMSVSMKIKTLLQKQA